MMSGGMKAVQGGVRLKLPEGVAWASLAAMELVEIRQKNLLPEGLLPLPHVKQVTGGQVFPQPQIDEIARRERRDLKRFDVDSDLPDHLTPEFQPTIFCPPIPNSATFPAANAIEGD
jgi:cytochrome c peroxidase